MKEVRVSSSRDGRSVGGQHLLKTFQNVCMQVIQSADGSGSDTRGELAAQRPAGQKRFLHWKLLCFFSEAMDEKQQIEKIWSVKRVLKAQCWKNLVAEIIWNIQRNLIINQINHLDCSTGDEATAVEECELLSKGANHKLARHILCNSNCRVKISLLVRKFASTMLIWKSTGTFLLQ